MSRRVARRMGPPTSLIWFRRDLRLADNPALHAALQSDRPATALYVLDEKLHFAVGGAQKWFLHHALKSLQSRLQAIGVPLIFRRGREAETVAAVAREAGACAVYWNRRYAPEEIAADHALKTGLKRSGVDAISFNGSLLREPWEVETKTRTPYRIFTPFWNSLRTLGPSRAAAPDPSRRQIGQNAAIASDALGEWNLSPSEPNWASAFDDEWRPNEEDASARLDRFLATPVRRYGEDRNRPDLDGTSRLSPHLALGTISPLTIWNATQDAIARGEIPEPEGLKFLSEIAWREFAYHLLYHNPQMPTAPLRGEFSEFPWRDDEHGFRAWRRGMTGVPIVDAGMRQLWRTGWMPNRVRMIVASFLVKNLLAPWQMGERWFWDTLIDADPANNTASWQWVAGCGADAAPYFRIFNPVAQGEKFDPAGDYVRRYVPEIAALPDDLIHAPWKAPSARRADDYPAPIVDLDQSRKRALLAYDVMKSRVRPLEKQVATSYVEGSK